MHKPKDDIPLASRQSEDERVLNPAAGIPTAAILVCFSANTQKYLQ